MVNKHIDKRRLLISYPEAKELQIFEDCILGNHYHKLKDERFILSEGECLLITAVNGEKKHTKMELGKIYRIDKYVKHKFQIKKDSILIGLNSEPYDPSDDYKWES